METAVQRVGRPFEKGQSGNPGGRPSGTSITAKVRLLLGTQAPPKLVARIVKGTKKEPGVQGYNITELPDVQMADIVALLVVHLAVMGDLDAIKLVWAYMDGKPRETVDVTGSIEHVQIDTAKRVLRVVGGIG